MWFWQISCYSFIILHFPSFSSSSHLHESTWELCCRSWKPHVPSDLCQVSDFSVLASVFIMRRWRERGSSSHLALRSQTRQEAPLLCPNSSQAGSTLRLPHTLTPVTQDGQFFVFCAQKGPVFSLKNRPSVQSSLQSGEGGTRRDQEEQSQIQIKLSCGSAQDFSLTLILKVAAEIMMRKLLWWLFSPSKLTADSASSSLLCRLCAAPTLSQMFYSVLKFWCHYKK